VHYCRLAKCQEVERTKPKPKPYIIHTSTVTVTVTYMARPYYGRRASPYSGKGARSYSGKRAVCMYWPDRCSKGPKCTFLHPTSETGVPVTAVPSNRNPVQAAAVPVPVGGVFDVAPSNRNPVEVAPAAAANQELLVAKIQILLLKGAPSNTNITTNGNKGKRTTSTNNNNTIIKEEENTAIEITPEKENKAVHVNAFFRPTPATKTKQEVPSTTTATTTSTSTTTKFPEEYRNAFFRKRNVNLTIENNRVVWHFTYNLKAIAAIKSCISGRTWEPAPRYVWTCPLESLPDCMALYQHMGRTPDAALVKRANEMHKAYQGTNPAQAMTLTIQMNMNTRSTPHVSQESLSLGTVTATFCYNVEIIERIKRLPPDQRSFNPTTKEWILDILSLPEFLQHLNEIGYTPSLHLQEIADSCQSMSNLLYGYGGDDYDSVSLASAEHCDKDNEDEFGDFAFLVDLDVDQVVEDRRQSLEKEENDSPIKLRKDIVDDDQVIDSLALASGDGEHCATNTNERAELPKLDVNVISQAVKVEETVTDEASKLDVNVKVQAAKAEETVTDEASKLDVNVKVQAAKVEETVTDEASKLLKARKLQDCFRSMITLVSKKGDATAAATAAVDRSDCGEFKKRRLTSAQEIWAMKRSGDYDYSDDDCDYLDDDIDDAFFNFLFPRKHNRSDQARTTSTTSRDSVYVPASNCDCGNPHKQIRGKHVCRYFGTYCCVGCGNQWTSGYSWIGEKQACRKCNLDNLAVETRPLARANGAVGQLGGRHDSSRCAMCRKVGYDCSL
jgi:hypothetical protein